MASLEPKLEGNITIDLRDPKYSEDIWIDKTGKTKIPLKLLDASILLNSQEDKLPLSNGVMFDTAKPRYGFKVIGYRQSKTIPTQCPLIGVQIVDEEVCIYEEGKMLPWRIAGNADVLDYAKFVAESRRDIKYIADEFSLSKDEVENINSYGLKYVSKEN